ncbi:hypothetical protein BFW01_g5128 [Lasiodiplodia theobromae]|nr:hypothetical protein BFW01_g5128 [Lasiodiplodia theobromae]
MGPPVKPYDLFRHKPLNLSENSFRLLDINGVSPEGLIECTINEYNRDDLHQSYRALSYTWGPETPAGWILLNGKAFRARENLIRFLEATSSHREARKGIWIDAICIDQDNTTEKMQQVKQMDDIYRNAATVFAWLGDATGDYQELHELLKKFEETPEGGVPNRSSAIFGILRGSSAVREQMLDVLSRPYWTRMWIIQEITLAQTDVRLLFGKHTLSWNTVKPLSVMIKSDVKYRLFFRTVPAYQVAKAADLLRSKSRPLTILGLLKELDGGGLCADARDKVYALLGMASDTGALEPDYTITGAELFFRVLKSETSLVKTNTVTIDDIATLKEAMGMQRNFFGSKETALQSEVFISTGIHWEVA